MTNNSFSFIVASDDLSGTSARTGHITTPHGDFDTPVFMPVATRASVKTVSPAQVKEAGSTIILGNTYHLALRPGAELMRKLGGLHRFMRWDGPILTDSGGFQVFSLANLRKISDSGVTFRSHINGDLFTFTPERVLEIQDALGSDIIMPLDHCIGWPSTYEEAREAMERSVRWAARSKEAKRQNQQTLFGIVQGSAYRDLRRTCAQELTAMDFSGYSIGGLAVGETKEIMTEMIAEVNAVLPRHKPRYLMGVGTPQDILMAVSQGVDMFDCVMPTRNARGGGAFTFSGKLQVRNSCYRESTSPIEDGCPCYCCQNFNRAYLHHLFSKKVEEVLGLVLLTVHNLTFYHRLMSKIRDAIHSGNYREFHEQFLHKYGKEKEREK
jgi:queuine tRNA-ribosyltransferase